MKSIRVVRDNWHFTEICGRTDDHVYINEGCIDESGKSIFETQIILPVSLMRAWVEMEKRP